MIKNVLTDNTLKFILSVHSCSPVISVIYRCYYPNYYHANKYFKLKAPFTL